MNKICCLLIFTLSLVANECRAAIPRCAEHMAEAEPGQVLSPSQLAINQSCLAELQMESAATDLRAHIAENERKIGGKKTDHPDGQPPVISNMGSSYPVAEDGGSEPRIVAIYTRGRRLYASLREGNGSSIEIKDGAKSVDGNRYHVTASTVSMETANGPKNLSYDAPMPQVLHQVTPATLPFAQGYKGSAQ